MNGGNVNSFLDCPSENDLLGFYRANLDGDHMDAIQDHLESCTTCILFFDTQDERSDTIVQALTSHSATTDDEIEFQRLQSQLLNNPEDVETEVWSAHLEGDSRRPHPQDRIGQCVGEYQLVELLGCGANGAVFKALHRKLDRFFALKLLDPRHASDSDSIERFHNEMKAVGRLDHPHIIRATDAGCVDGQYFLAMEYIDGIDVSRLVRKCGRLSVADAAEVIRQAAIGLNCAHENGMVHRDVKPSNLFFDFRGKIKILDLGLVAISESPDEDAPNILARGTADYMSPEQWDNYRNVDLKADIYSLGCTFYKLLAGDAPFAKIPFGFAGKMQAHQCAPVPPLRSVRHDVPLGLERIVRRMVSKKQSDRPSSMMDLVDSLAPYAEEHQLQEIVKRLCPGFETQARENVETHCNRPLFSRRRLVVAAGIGGVACLGYQLFGRNAAAPKKQTWRTLEPENLRQLVSLDKTATAKFDTNKKAITVHSKDATLLPLGNPIHGKFIIETLVESSPKSSRAGFAFRYRKTKQTIGTLHPFQSIELARDSKGSLQIQWRHYQWSFSRVASDIQEESWASAPLKVHGQKPLALRIELGSSPFPTVFVNETEIRERAWSLSKQANDAKQITRKKLTEEYLGTIGLFAVGHGTKFSQTRLKYSM